MQEPNTIAQTVVWAAHRLNLERELAAAADVNTAAKAGGGRPDS